MIVAKIIRTPTRAAGGITEKERALMEQHTKMWIERAFRTRPIEPKKIIQAIRGLYAAADLEKPRVVIVPSPLVMAFAYGAASAIWHHRGVVSTDVASAAATYAAPDAVTYATRDATDAATRTVTYTALSAATYDATYAATRDATYAAARDATYAATDAATRDATYAATRAATRIATDAATDDATSYAARDATSYAARAATDAATRAVTYTASAAATRAATHDATRDVTYAATRAATRDATDAADITKGAQMACHQLAGNFGIQCAKYWYQNYQGGNMWASFDCYLTAARDILGLSLEQHSKYKFWEQAAIHGSFRVVHKKFCIVSDFPEFIKIDANNLPHCETGPSLRWRDGWSIYHWHGIEVPAHWIENRDTLDPSEVLKCDNVEQRAAGMEIVGWAKAMDILDCRVIDSDQNPDHGDLIELILPGLEEPGRFLRAYCPRNGLIVEGVPEVSDIDGKPIATVRAAQAWSFGYAERDFIYPDEVS